MHIEVWHGKVGSKQAWWWHVKSKGRIVTDAEPFPTKAHALRAAKAMVRAVVKPIDAAVARAVHFNVHADGARFVLEWY